MSTRAKVWQQAGKLNFLMEPWHNNMAKEDIEFTVVKGGKKSIVYISNLLLFHDISNIY